MNYYNEIKEKLIDNEIFAKAKDYSKEKNTVKTYFEIGRLLYKAKNKYGENIIQKYSDKLTTEVGKKYNYRTLYRMRKLYEVFSDEKLTPLVSKLTWSHYLQLLNIKNPNKIVYYINISIRESLSKRQLENKIKSNEYERLDNKTKEKLIKQEVSKIEDFIKNPIIIKNIYNTTEISEKMLKKMILEYMDNFLDELGIGFSYIKNEYKIKMGSSYNYIDLLLYNIKYKCYVVVELKVTELKAEYMGQIKKYISYIDKNIKSINESNTVGIIVCHINNELIMEYCSDDRIFSTTYMLN